ncbi:response regulator [Pedococcus sp. P5_B7]
MIADDDADVRALLSLAVDRASLASVQVEDGRQAIEMLADLSPSVVLLDVKMPGLSGIEVCWWIRRQRHLGDVPVILVSALTSQFEIDAGLLAGANQYVTKPFTRAHITAAVAHHLLGRPPLPPPTRVIMADPADWRAKVTAAGQVAVHDPGDALVHRPLD